MINKRVCIIGFGQFGAFMYKYLVKYFNFVYVYDPYVSVKNDSINFINKEDIINKKIDIIIFAVPFPALKDICIELSNLIKINTLIIDVISVKVLPIKIFKKYFPNNPILGTHPIFGPQSGKKGINGLSIVLTQVSFTSNQYDLVKNFLKTKLQLIILEKTPEEHDKEMAYVQGISHFIGRALKNMPISNFDTATYSYKQLLHLVNLLKDDSFELFKTIENSNPFVKGVRDSFLKELHSLEKRLSI